MSISLSIDQVLRLRLRAQHLFTPNTSPDEPRQPADLAKTLCGLQAQDLGAAAMAFRARSGAMRAEDVEDARQAGRLVRTWVMRGTLHLLAPDDACWLVPYLGTVFIPFHRRRLEQLGWDAPHLGEGLRLLKDALSSRGALTRIEIIRLVSEQRLPSQGQAPVHLIYHAAFEGSLIQGPDREQQPTYIRFEEWAGQPVFMPLEEALAALALRYLAGNGPAGTHDFAAWSGLPATIARTGWALIKGLVEQVDVPGLAGEPLVILKTQLPWLDQSPFDPTAVCLLPRFDNYLLNYADRRMVVDPAFTRRINSGGGMIASVVVAADGRVIATWKEVKRRDGLELSVNPFGSLDHALIPALEAETVDLGRFMNTSVEVKII